MPTLRERILDLSPLAPGATFRAHMLAITQNGILQVFEVMEVELEMADYEVAIEAEYTVQLQDNEYQVELDPEEYTVEFCQ